MSTQRVNVRKDFRFQIDIETPNTAGDLAQPAAGAVTGVTLRLSAAEFGTAIHANVDGLAASEAAGKAGRFFVLVDTSLLVNHVLAAVGNGGPFYAVWSKSGDFDKESTRFLAVDGHRVP